MAPSGNQGAAQTHHDGSSLRVAIVHARWNGEIVDALVDGARQKLLAAGVAAQNIIVQSVPGTWELPVAVQRLYAASQAQGASAGSTSAGDLLSSSSADLIDSNTTAATSTTSSSASASSSEPFDAMIAVGVLIKGETMHFEYIADAAVHGLMRVQLDSGVPVILGVLTVLTDDQGRARAGLANASSEKVHNHGEDWGLAAVELGVRRRAWAAGKIE